MAKRKLQKPKIAALKRVRNIVADNNKPKGPRKRSPMEKERVLSTMKSKAQAVGGNVRSREEMKAATEGLDTLTSKGPGKLKLALRGGGRAYGKNS